MKKITLRQISVLWIVSALLLPAPLLAENAAPVPRNQEPKEVQDLLTEQDQLRKSFLDELYDEGKEVHAQMGSEISQEEKDKLLEDFRIQRLKRLEEFQTSDTMLKQRIEDARHSR